MFLFLKRFFTSPIFPILTLLLLHGIKNETVKIKAELDSLNQTIQQEENLKKNLESKWTKMTTPEKLKKSTNVQPITGKQIKPIGDIESIPIRQPLIPIRQPLIRIR